MKKQLEPGTRFVTITFVARPNNRKVDDIDEATVKGLLVLGEALNRKSPVDLIIAAPGLTEIASYMRPSGYGAPAVIQALTPCTREHRQLLLHNLGERKFSGTMDVKYNPAHRVMAMAEFTKHGWDCLSSFIIERGGTNVVVAGLSSFLTGIVWYGLNWLSDGTSGKMLDETWVHNNQLHSVTICYRLSSDGRLEYYSKEE